MPGECQGLVCEGNDVRGNLGGFGRVDPAPAFNKFRPRVLVVEPVPERPSDVSDGVLGAIRDDVGDLGRVSATVFSNTYWMTSSRRSVSKSTSMSGGSSRSRRQEPFERQSVVNRVNRGDAQQRKQTAEFAALPRPWHRIRRDRANCTMSWTMRKYPGKSSSSMTVSSRSIRLSVSGGASGYLRGVASATSSRSRPSGSGRQAGQNWARWGVAFLSSNANSCARSAARSTAPGVSREQSSHFGGGAQSVERDRVTNIRQHP
jgi:hypothetical protein